jgi:hypothetical protein
MAIAFSFEILGAGSVEEFAQGHVTVCVDDARASTKDRNSSVMIFLTMVSFLDSARLVVTGARKSAMMMGVDSSFDIAISRTRANRIRLAYRRNELGVVAPADLVGALWMATRTFVSDLGIEAMVRSSSAAAFSDLRDATDKFRSTFQLDVGLEG